MRLLFSGGGTGGGVYPALAVIAALRAPPALTSPLRAQNRTRTSGSVGIAPAPLPLGEGSQLEVLWVGGNKGPERDLVTREGIAFEAVASAPIAGVGWRVIFAPFLIGIGLIQSLMLVMRFKPQALLITGGWVTIPPALACWLLGIPVMIYLPDVEPGGTISILGKVAQRVGVNAPESARFFRDGQTVETGYPVRAELLEAAGFMLDGNPNKQKALSKDAARKPMGIDGKEPVLLIFGGSTGARSINRAVIDYLPDILEQGWQVIHVSGRLDADWVGEAARHLHMALAKHYHHHEYLHSGDMAKALACADLVVSRAGASILGEFPLFALPAILVPYPFVWRYQKTNADRLAGEGAAIRLDDETLGTDLVPLLARLKQNAAERQQMSAAAAALKRPDAAARLAGELSTLAKKRD